MIEPVRRLDSQARSIVLAHLLALDTDDRYARFGSALRDAGIRALVARLDFERDLLLGMEAAGDLVGLAHVGFGGGGLAELALSVAPPWRRRGMAFVLFGLTAHRAVRAGITGFACIHGHPATLSIARDLGLAVRLQAGDPRAIISFAPSGARIRAGDDADHRPARSAWPTLRRSDPGSSPCPRRRRNP